MPRLTIEYRPVSALLPYVRNARTHPETQIVQVMRSIGAFGWTNPILVGEGGEIIAGHARVIAAQRLKITEVPTICIAGLTDAQRRALILADNRIAEGSGWDVGLLQLEIGNLKVEGFDLSLTGFDLGEIADLLAPGNNGLTDPDDAPDVQATAISRPGDVWLLGSHRLACGDCTNAAVVEALLAGAKPHLMVTDPPYGVNYDPNWRNEAKRPNGLPYGASALGKVTNDTRSDWTAAWALFPGDVAYVWCAAGPLSCAVHDSLRASDLHPRMQIVWAKSQFVIGRGNYHLQHETCWYAIRKGAVTHWQGDRTQSTLWQIDKPRTSETGHSTQKPIACMKRPIENNSRPSQAVYDPFCGSGTTVIAAEMTGRTCFAIEIDPAYADLTIRRWQTFTGKAATLEADATTFAQVSAARGEMAA